jgi:ABC-type amino acid transport substrate-binding protein
MRVTRCVALCAAVFVTLVGSARAEATDYDYADYGTESENGPALAYREGAIPFFENQTVINVCSSPWTSAVECDTEEGPEQWSTASGYEIEVFKKMMPILGWTDEMINFTCMGWTEMMDALVNGTWECDIAPAGMAPEYSLMEEGVLFSDHTLQSGVTILLASNQDQASRDIWYFFSAMTWEVWVALLVTSFVAGAIVWLMEVGSKTLNAETRYLTNVVWDTVGRPVQMRDYRVASLAGNTVAWVWSFTAFIVMSLYNAALTANMTIQSINNQITSFADLQGKRVGTWDDYTDDLLEDGISAIGFPWDTEEDEQHMMDALVRGEISALVLDETALRFLDAKNCSTMILEDVQPLRVMGQTAGFPSRTPMRTLNAYNGALRELMEKNQIGDLRDEFIFVEQASCKKSGLNSDFMSVTWNDVAGLWVILALSVALACLTILSYRVWHHALRKRAALKKTVDLSQNLSRAFMMMAEKNMSDRDRDFDLNSAMDPHGSEMLRYDGYQGASAGYVDGSADASRGIADVYALVQTMQRELTEVKHLLEMKEQQK